MITSNAALKLRACTLGVLAVALAAPAPVSANEVRDQAMLVELGGYAGLFFPSSQHELFAPGAPQARFSSVTAAFGARATWLPLYFVGAELELGFMPTSTSNDHFAQLYTFRGHVIGQLPVWRRLCPFALFGGGLIGVASSRDAVGDNVDSALHWGAGAKYYVTDALAIRAEFRQIIAPGAGLASAHHFEALVGAAWVLGWRKARKQPVSAAVANADHQTPPLGLIPDSQTVPDKPAAKRKAYKAQDCGFGKGPGPTECPPADDTSDVDALLDSAARNVARQEKESASHRTKQPASAPAPDSNQQLTAIAQQLVFASGKAQLDPATHAALDELIELLQAHPELALLIRGHTDSTGGKSLNRRLSAARARAVKAYLVAGGVVASRLEVEGVGAARPIADNGTPEGRAKNRRIELVATASQQ